MAAPTKDKERRKYLFNLRCHEWQIDVLVADGKYRSKSDAVNAAIAEKLERISPARVRRLKKKLDAS